LVENEAVTFCLRGRDFCPDLRMLSKWCELCVYEEKRSLIDIVKQNSAFVHGANSPELLCDHRASDDSGPFPHIRILFLSDAFSYDAYDCFGRCNVMLFSGGCIPCCITFVPES